MKYQDVRACDKIHISKSKIIFQLTCLSVQISVISMDANLLPMAILAFSAKRYRCSFSIPWCSCLLLSFKAAFLILKDNEPNQHYCIVESIWDWNSVRFCASVMSVDCREIGYVHVYHWSPSFMDVILGWLLQKILISMDEICSSVDEISPSIDDNK